MCLLGESCFCASKLKDVSPINFHTFEVSGKQLHVIFKNARIKCEYCVLFLTLSPSMRQVVLCHSYTSDPTYQRWITPAPPHRGVGTAEIRHNKERCDNKYEPRVRGSMMDCSVYREN